MEPFRNLRLPSTRTLARFLAEAQASVRLRGHVAVLLTTDAVLRDLNHRFRGKNKPTDVLSFPAEPFPGAKPAERVVGDVAISVETASRQGTACGHSLETELKILMLHGLLHLAGYDHESDAGQMHRRERTLRTRLGLPSGLIERAENAPMVQALKGHGFSRAVMAQKKSRALAPEGRTSEISQGHRNPQSRRGQKP